MHSVRLTPFALGLATGLALAMPNTMTITAEQIQEDVTLRKEIEKISAEMMDTVKRGRTQDVAKFYADDATLYYSRDQRTHGRKAIDEYWARLTGGKQWKLEIKEVGGTRDRAYQIGRSTFTTEGPEGERVSACDFVVIWKRQKDGSLKIFTDIYN
jgi:ketosteroid isomerase-like protein